MCIDCHIDQFLHSRSGRWRLLFAISHYVRKKRRDRKSSHSLLENLFFRLPLNLIPPFGYLTVWCIEIVFFVCGNFSVVPMFSLSFGSCLFIHFFTKDITNDLSKLNVSKVSTSTSTSQQSHPNSQAIKVHFRNAVQIFEDAKRLGS